MTSPHLVHTSSTVGHTHVHRCGKQAVHSLADMWITRRPVGIFSSGPQLPTHLSFGNLVPRDPDLTILVIPEIILNRTCESLLSLSPDVDKAVEKQHDGTPGQDRPVRQVHRSLSSSTQCPGRHRSGCPHRVHHPCRSGVRRARRRQHQMALSPRGALQLRGAGPGQDVHDSHDSSHRRRWHSRSRRRIGLRQGHRRAGTRSYRCRRHPGLGTAHAHRGHGRHLLGGLTSTHAPRGSRTRQSGHRLTVTFTVTFTVGVIPCLGPTRTSRSRPH